MMNDYCLVTDLIGELVKGSAGNGTIRALYMKEGQLHALVQNPNGTLYTATAYRLVLVT